MCSIGYITLARLDMADRWFERRGERSVVISRCLPIIRTFISLPAGIACLVVRRWRGSAHS